MISINAARILLFEIPQLHRHHVDITGIRKSVLCYSVLLGFLKLETTVLNFII